MTTIETFGKCKCGEYNPFSGIVCNSCGARLPWTATPRAPKPGSGTYTLPPNSAMAAATPRTQAAQAGYWNSATGASAVGATAYANAPDIDFTPLSPMTRPDHYCPSCGMALSRAQDVCPRCRHMKSFTTADLRLTLMVGALITTGFLLGVVWTSILVNYLQTGKFPLQSATTVTQKAPAKKAPAKPALPPPNYSGTPAR